MPHDSLHEKINYQGPTMHREESIITNYQTPEKRKFSVNYQPTLYQIIGHDNLIDNLILST